MADPFEVRMRFTSQLQHLNASTSSAHKAANYALRHAEFSDDLHSCILEQLERNNMNNRANIMYFLPALCDTAKAQGEIGYIRMMERDILRIIDLVAPDDGSGAANVKVVRKVLGILRERTFLQPQTVVELEECIVGRDSGAVEASPQRGGRTVDATADAAVRNTPQSMAREGGGMGAGMFNPGIRLDKRQIEQRIEEDRERHKRAREGIWAIAQQPSMAGLAVDAEFDRSWEDGSVVDDDDYRMAREEAEERRKHLEFDDY